MNREFQKQLDAIVKGKPSKVEAPSLFGKTTSTDYSSSASFSSPLTLLDNIKEVSIFQKIFYVFIAVFVIMLILIGIHFLVHPILPEWITNNAPLPGMIDATSYWNKGGTLVQIPNAETPITTLHNNYTAMIDIQVDNPTNRIGKSRIMLIRGEPEITTDSAKAAYESAPANIRTIVPTYNFIMFFDTTSTDLHISVTTKDTANTIAQEAVIIKNFPIQKSVRLSIVLMKKSIEVYINGQLYKVRSLSGDLYDTKGNLYPPLPEVGGNSAPFARVKNLRLWARPLAAKEIRYWGSGEDFSSVDTTDTCVS